MMVLHVEPGTFEQLPHAVVITKGDHVCSVLLSTVLLLSLVVFKIRDCKGRICNLCVYL